MRYVVKRVQAREQGLIHAVVSRVMPFHDTSSVHIGALEKQCWTFVARAGEVLVKRGDRLPGVCAIAYGSAKLVLQRSHHEGRVLRVVTAGQTFGEATALLGLPAPYDAVALSDSKLVVIPSAAILSLIDREPRFARSVIKILAERNLEVLEEIEASTMRRGAQRLASYLGSLVPPDAPSGPCTVRLPVSKTVVAARLGLKKETLSRLFRQFADDGLIEVSRRDVTILDRRRLTETSS